MRTANDQTALGWEPKDMVEWTLMSLVRGYPSLVHGIKFLGLADPFYAGTLLALYFRVPSIITKSRHSLERTFIAFLEAMTFTEARTTQLSAGLGLGFHHGVDCKLGYHNISERSFELFCIFN